jgi:hypothetical protein
LINPFSSHAPRITGLLTPHATRTRPAGTRLQLTSQSWLSPAALTDAQILADPDGLLEAQFNDEAIIAGRACRDALAWVCEWHRVRGDDEVKACRAD